VKQAELDLGPLLDEDVVDESPNIIGRGTVRLENLDLPLRGEILKLPCGNERSEFGAPAVNRRRQAHGERRISRLEGCAEAVITFEHLVFDFLLMQRLDVAVRKQNYGETG